MIYSENILVCIAFPLLIALIFVGKRNRRFLLSFVIGMICCLLSAYITGYVQFVSETEPEKMSAFFSPIFEELMKIMPLLFYMFVFTPKASSLFSVALGVGLGFATFENCCYILSFGASNLSYAMIRALAVGIMHLVCALTLVFGLTNARHFRVLSLPAVIGSVSLSMVFHGLYNLLVSRPGLTSVFGYVMPIITAIVLYIPFRAVKRQETERENIEGNPNEIK
ncbi:MAG: PrsW family intramembrane metalloprotease [Lachnospiraceae bacterium]|nr:PrsW family intramembrane metalloprotease [Lachnospiraceae bacterium]